MYMVTVNLFKLSENKKIPLDLNNTFFVESPIKLYVHLKHKTAKLNDCNINDIYVNVLNTYKLSDDEITYITNSDMV